MLFHIDIIKHIYNRLPAEKQLMCRTKHYDLFSDIVNIDGNYYLICCNKTHLYANNNGLSLLLEDPECVDKIYDELLRKLDAQRYN